jgi:hypothetical protein
MHIVLNPKTQDMAERCEPKVFSPRGEERVALRLLHCLTSMDFGHASGHHSGRGSRRDGLFNGALLIGSPLVIPSTKPPQSVLAVEDGTVDVGPKLFDDVEDSVQGDLRDPLLAGLRPGPLSGGII